MVVSALRDNGSEAESRTSLTESDGALSCVWTEGDRILVTDASGKKLGRLTIKAEDAGKKEAEFSGDLTGIEDGTQTLNYYYLGTAVSVGDDATAYNKEIVLDQRDYVADFSTQLGTLESLSKYDMLSTSQTTVLDGEYSYFERIAFSRHISFARFKMLLPEGVAFPVTVTMEGSELCNTATLTLADRKVDCAKGSVTIENVEGQEFYMTYLPTAASDEVTFTAVDKNGKSYVGKYNISKAVGENKYFRKALGNGEYEGINVTFEAVKNQYSIRYEAEDGTTIYEGKPESADDIVWTVRNDEVVNPPVAPNDQEFDKWKIKETNEYPATVTLSKATPSYTFVPTWKDKATVNVTWNDGYTEDPIKTEGVKVGENEEKNIGDLFPENPTREGYVFDGWEINGEPVNPADVTITKEDVENGVVITARWKIYTITTPGYGHGDFNS